MEVKLFAVFRENRGKAVKVDWYEGVNGHAVLEALDISPQTVATYLINGKNADLGVTLSESDVISIFPPVGGG